MLVLVITVDDLSDSLSPSSLLFCESFPGLVETTNAHKYIPSPGKELAVFQEVSPVLRRKLPFVLPFEFKSGMALGIPDFERNWVYANVSYRHHFLPIYLANIRNS